MKITITHEECFLVIRSDISDKVILCLTTESALEETKKLLEEYRKELGHE